jgi:hypothetical protein
LCEEHCINHRANLTLKDTLKMKLLKCFADAKELAGRARNAVHTAARMPKLIYHQQQMGIVQEVPVDLSKIRFPSLGEATIVLIRQLPPILATLDDVIKEASKKDIAVNAQALRSRLASNPFLICLSIEAVCVNVLNISNKQFQSRLLNFSSYRASMVRTIQELQEQKDRNGPAAFLLKQLEGGKPLGNYYKFNATDWAAMGKKTILFVDSLIEALNARFPELDQLCDFDIFDPNSRPKNV